MAGHDPHSNLTEEILLSFLACRYKAHLKLRRAVCEESDYTRFQARTATEYRNAARQSMLEFRPEAVTAQDPPSLADAIRGGADLIFDATISEGDESCRLDAVERVAEGNDRTGGAYIPVLFTQHERVMPEDRLRLAFGASLLARVTGTQSARGQIVFGPQLQTTRVSLPVLDVRLKAVVGQIRDLHHADQPPPMLLNRHCQECEFRSSCRAVAIEKDDLSLLRGLSPKTIAALNRRGIFTVTQYSHTFRPGRMKRALKGLGGKHDLSLQALAIREKKIYVARRPDLPAVRVNAYLDVEGVPDRAFYYLIGLSWDDGTGVRRSSYWAEREADEGTIWGAFLRDVGELGDDFTMFHYGSYELQFLKRMEERYGGDPVVMARLKAKCVNVLSAIHAQVYFPVYANELKSVAGCLGSQWSAPDASGLQSIVWRAEWEAIGAEVLKQRLLDYNREDCEALERVVQVLRGLAGNVASGGDGICPTVAGVEDIKAPRRHKFCDPQFVLPEFARISKCAYFDYQRDRVLFRTSPAVKRANRRKTCPRQATHKVNRIVECVRPTRCPHCGSTDIDGLDRNTRLVVDLKPTRGGLRQWTTRYSAKRFRCSKCDQVFLPDEFLAIRTHRYGWTLCGWVAYACVALRQTSRATTDALDDMFGVHFQSGMVTHLREQAAERYRGTYESLLNELRTGRLVHADETWAHVKGSSGKVYVWVFASPDTAVYVYSPNREGETLRQTLAGFQGVLVSDFYAVYDSLDCPQQKCLVHLVRDLNDDLLKNPFDEELKGLAARFGTLLQAVVETIDKYGLKRHHLGKHKRSVEQFFERVAAAVYRSDVARHYRQRLLKNRSTLFTFLDYDGVPWNNNNAENAVKRFVTRRTGMAGTAALAEKGLKEYLVLLSIYQTLRYRQLNFWDFLRSGETDLAKYTAAKR